MSKLKTFSLQSSTEVVRQRCSESQKLRDIRFPEISRPGCSREPPPLCAGPWSATAVSSAPAQRSLAASPGWELLAPRPSDPRSVNHAGQGFALLQQVGNWPRGPG